MGNRLSKIYTRTGDDGTTGLGDGSRVSKASLRVETYGTIDELNSHIGMVLALGIDPTLHEPLGEIQHLLFDLGGELCLPGHQIIEQKHVDWLEWQLDRLNIDLPTLKEFILPGGSQSAAACHVARTVCRRAERLLVSLARVEQVHAPALAFLNRLSDYLFVVARVLARAGDGEVLWRGQRRTDPRR
ncbi:MAG TPA: cob(I)yrinic acid a,c-diamide adenosyltransferase [Methylococcaceae bacterium]|nr:cob(I)yrinic acid a,c-diamide adenosyltransferase [Methylococcaceae bacterium]